MMRLVSVISILAIHIAANAAEIGTDGDGVRVLTEANLDDSLSDWHFLDNLNDPLSNRHFLDKLNGPLFGDDLLDWHSLDNLNIPSPTGTSLIPSTIL